MERLPVILQILLPKSPLPGFDVKAPSAARARGRPTSLPKDNLVKNTWGGIDEPSALILPYPTIERSETLIPSIRWCPIQRSIPTLLNAPNMGPDGAGLSYPGAAPSSLSGTDHEAVLLVPPTEFSTRGTNPLTFQIDVKALAA